MKPKHRARRGARPSHALALALALGTTGLYVTTQQPLPVSSSAHAIARPSLNLSTYDRGPDISRALTRPVEDVRATYLRAQTTKRVEADVRREAVRIAAAEARKVAAAKAAREAAAARAAAREAKRQAAADAAAEAAEQAAADAAAALPVGSVQQIAHETMIEFGFPETQWPYLARLIERESGWRVTATNPSSGAYGLPQSLPGIKMATVAPDWKTNPRTQITWMCRYITDRYGNPQAALAHSDRLGWY